MTDTSETFNQFQEEAKRRGLTLTRKPPVTKASQDAIREEAKKRGLRAFEIDSSPLPRPADQPRPTPRASIEGINVDDPGLQPAERNPIIDRAADAGVIFDQPARSGHFLSSLGFNEAERLKAFQKALGADTPVRRGQATGKIEYFDPATNRFALAAPPDAIGASVEALGGASIALLPEIIGAGAAAVFTKSPALVSMAGGAGAFTGEIARIELGRQLGINQDVTNEQMFTEAAITAGFATAGGVASEKVLRAGKLVLDLIRGRFVPKSTLDSLELSVEDAQNLADTINERIDAHKLQLSLAQGSGDEHLLALEDMFKRNPAYRQRFGEFEREQQIALKEFYDLIGKGYQSRQTLDEVEADVRSTAGTLVENEIFRAEAPVLRARAKLNDSLTSLKERDPSTFGSLLRTIGDEEQAAFRQWADDAAASIGRLTDDTPFIPNTEVAAIANRIDRKVQDAIFPSLESGQRRLVGESLEVVEGANGQSQEVVARLFDPNHLWTFDQAWNALSSLKRAARVASKGLSTDDPAVGTIKNFIGTLESSMKKAMDNSPLADEYDDFVRQYAIEKQRLDTGTVGQIMTREGGRNGRWRIDNENVFREVFPRGGVTGAEEVYNLVKNRPDAMQAVRETLQDFYLRSVKGSDGKIDIAAHERWWQDHGKQVRQFFRKEDGSIDKQAIAEMRQVGGFAKALQKREEAFKRATDQINQSFEAKISNLNTPGALFNLAINAKAPQQVDQLVAILKSNGAHAALRGLRAEARKFMSNRVMGPFQATGSQAITDSGRHLSAANLDTFLNGKSGEAGFADVFTRLFDAQYVGDLQTLNTALKVASRETAFPNRSNTAFWAPMLKNITRAYVGLFTRPGRFLTALDAMRGRAADRILAESILRPDDLRELVKHAGVDIRSRKGAAIVGSLGGAALLQEFETD